MLRALRGSPKLRLFLKSPSRKFIFYENNFDLSSTILKTRLEDYVKKNDWLEAFICLFLQSPISRVHPSPIEFCPPLGHEGDHERMMIFEQAQ